MFFIESRVLIQHAIAYPLDGLLYILQLERGAWGGEMSLVDNAVFVCAWAAPWWSQTSGRSRNQGSHLFRLGFAQVVSLKSPQITFSSYGQLLNTVAPGQKWHSSPDRNLCITQTVGFGGSSQLFYRASCVKTTETINLLRYLQRLYLYGDNQPKIQRDSFASNWLKTEGPVPMKSIHKGKWQSQLRNVWMMAAEQSLAVPDPGLLTKIQVLS